MSTRDRREAAFRDAGAILALERMVEPEGYAQLRQAVIDGTLSLDEAVVKVIEQSKKKTGRSEASAGR